MLAQAPQGVTNETGSQPCLLELGIFRLLLFQDQPLWVSFLYAGDEPTGAGSFYLGHVESAVVIQREGSTRGRHPMPVQPTACLNSEPS